jgi:hypothetical protein
MMLLRVFVIAVVLAASTAAQAQLFDYSYTFQSGGVASGSFNGDASGNLITNLSNISASYNGIPLTGSGSLFNAHYDSSIPSIVSGGAVVSFDGLANNFFFMDVDYPSNPSLSAGFYMVNFSSEALIYNASPYINIYDPVYNVANWSVTADGAPVPEPGTMMLLGLGRGMVGLAVYRKRCAIESAA